MTIGNTKLMIASVPWRWLDTHWRNSTAVFNLSIDALHVWRGYVDTWAQRVDSADFPLTDAEQQRAAGIRNIRRRHQFLAARTLTRLLLNRYLQHGDARVMTQDGGRVEVNVPRFSPPLFLSISHTHNLFVVAVARRRCAVDLEKITDIHRYSGIVRQLLPAACRHALSRLEEHPLEQARLFIEYWTAFESTYKLQGEGPFPRYLRKIAAPTPERYIAPLWGRHFALYPGYIGAVATCADVAIPIFYDADACFNPHISSGATRVHVDCDRQVDQG